MKRPVTKIVRHFNTAKSLLIHRGIVREAASFARPKIIRRVISGFLLIIVTAGVFVFAWHVIANGDRGGEAVILFGLMSLIGLITDKNKWYFVSWLFNDPDIVYNSYRKR